LDDMNNVAVPVWNVSLPLTKKVTRFAVTIGDKVDVRVQV